MSTKWLLSEKEVHGEYGLTVPWLRKRRRVGGGPTFLKIGKLVKYNRADLDRYLAAHVIKNTVETES